ncbi:MAG: HAMP domain-containing histidine kinase [Rhizobiaceae bacterium]|nr:HAMP domain-containing histidine kinase [Rhizobiaceae bacterium]
MIRRRLHLQIYVTIIFSLILVVLLTSMFFWLGNRDDADFEFKRAAGQLAINILPNADQPVVDQNEALKELFKDIDVNVSLFDQDGQLITSIGEVFEFPFDEDDKQGMHHQGDNQGFLAQLPDGRWLFTGRYNDRQTDGGFVKLLLVLGSIALAIGVASYPLVRRLTRRLENLKTGVEQVGMGDLKTRVEVEGKDEIASLAESFNYATAQIENLVASHKTLLANASHELRTPLSRIRLGLEMYQSGHEQKRLDALRSDIEELDGLIEEILLMSRLDSANSSLVTEAVDLEQIIDEECERFPDIEFNGSAPMIDGNAGLLKRVVRNLIGNAFKHGKPPVIVDLGQSGDHVCVTVTDHGNGISEADKQKIFERFYRGADRQNVEGYGLGLSLVKQIIDAHKGTIEVLDSKGFLIKVTLPINH